MSTTNLDELDPDSPEYQAAMEAAQDAEDAANGTGEVTTETTTEDEPEDPATPEAKPAFGEAAEPAAKVAGIASKDGTRVLPYSALQAERRAARVERKARGRVEQELAATKQQLEDLKAGKAPAAAPDDDLSQEEIDAAAQDFPAVAKVAKQLKEVKAQIATMTTTKPAAEDDAPTSSDPEQAALDALQEDIDSVPLLLEWQTSDPEKFSRAVEIDRVLVKSPKWADKPQADRFKHVTAMVADEYDIQMEDSAPRSTPTPSRADPKKVISTAARTVPNTLSDFKGGSPDQPDERLERMPAAKQMQRMESMSDAEIEAYLARLG